MNSDSDQQRKSTRIDTSLTEIHTLISALEAQLKSGLYPASLDIKAVEPPMPKNFAPDREEAAFLADRCLDW